MPAMRESTRAPTVGDLAELSARLDRDGARARAALWRRDREIGRELAGLRGEPARQLVAWSRRVGEVEGPREAASRLNGERVDRAQRGVSALVTVAGAAVGWGVAAAVFWYTGERPINVIAVLAVFVFLQVALLVLTAVAALPEGWLRRVPGAEAAGDAVRLLSPGRVALAVAAVLSPKQRDAIEGAVGRIEGHRRVYGRVQKWVLLRWSQLFALAFNAAAVAHFAALITFTDLAFGWSTTLPAEAPQVHAAATALAAPWGWALPDAVPTRQLVEATQFVRFGDVTRAGLTEEDAARFGGWWPFVLLCMVLYGVLPRAVSLAVALVRLRRAIEWTVAHTPGAAAVLDRLNSEYVETRAEEAGGESDEAETPTAAPSPAAPGGARFVVNWAGVPLPDEVLAEPFGSARVYACGGAKTLDEDRETARRAVAETGGSAGAGGVVLVAKSWEPPMLEVVDFLADLRAALGEGVAVTVVPVKVDGGRLAAGDAAHVAQWQRRVASAGDPWAVVGTPPGREEVAP